MPNCACRLPSLSHLRPPTGTGLHLDRWLPSCSHPASPPPSLIGHQPLLSSLNPLLFLGESLGWKFNMNNFVSQFPKHNKLTIIITPMSQLKIFLSLRNYFYGDFHTQSIRPLYSTTVLHPSMTCYFASDQTTDHRSAGCCLRSEFWTATPSLQSNIYLPSLHDYQHLSGIGLKSCILGDSVAARSMRI